jgi:hypothetical protein
MSWVAVFTFKLLNKWHTSSPFICSPWETELSDGTIVINGGIINLPAIFYGFNVVFIITY